MRYRSGCPYCGSENVDAEFVDVGVGFEQVTAAECGECGSVQVNPHDEEAKAKLTEVERKVYWHRGEDVTEEQVAKILGSSG